MKHAKKQLSIGFGAALLICGAALGQSHKFGDFDANHDAGITLDEWHGGMADVGIFSDRDRNGDERLDETEFDALGYDDDFSDWDTNDDSYVDDDEFYQGSFDYFDEDENGHWDGDEWDDAGDAGFWDV